MAVFDQIFVFRARSVIYWAGVGYPSMWNGALVCYPKHHFSAGCSVGRICAFLPTTTKATYPKKFASVGGGFRVHTSSLAAPSPRPPFRSSCPPAATTLRSRERARATLLANALSAHVARSFFAAAKNASGHVHAGAAGLWLCARRTSARVWSCDASRQRIVGARRALFFCSGQKRKWACACRCGGLVVVRSPEQRSLAAVARSALQRAFLRARRALLHEANALCFRSNGAILVRLMTLERF